MKAFSKALGIGLKVLGAGTKTAAAVTHFIISKVIGAGGSVTIQSLLLASNACFLYAGIKAWRRSRFAATVRMLTDLDEDGLKYVMKNLPSWVKFSDYERAKFLNDALQMLWPAFDTALCNLIKDELEPYMRDFSPAVVSGMYFERLSFGLVPMSILGVRIVPSFHANQHVSIELDVDVRWAGEPDVLLKLEPSTKWITNAVKIGKLKVLPAVNMTPVMAVRMRQVQISAIMRVSLSPVLDDLPFIGGISLSLMAQPYIDFDLRLVAGPDIMSVPALSSYLQASLMEVFIDQMIWPRVAQIPFMMPSSDEHEIAAPHGILTVQVIEAKLPQRLSRLRRVEKPLDPYTCLAVRPHSGPVETGTQSASTSGKQGTTHPHWREAFHLCVASTEQTLEVVVVHASGSNSDHAADVPLGRVDIPIKEIMREAARPRGMRLASAAKIAYKLRQASQRARERVADKHVAETHLRRESEPAGLREDRDSEELRPDLRSDSAPATAAPFLDGTGKPPKCPLGSWRSNSDTSQLTAKGGRPYKRSLSDEHLMSPVRTVTEEEEEEEEGHDAGHLATAAGGASTSGQTHCEGLAKALDSPMERQSSNAIGWALEATSVNADMRHPEEMINPSPAKMLPSLPTHTPNRTAHEAALAACAEEGAWLPLLPVNAHGGINAAPESFFPTLPTLSSLVEDAAEGFSNLFIRTPSDRRSSDETEDGPAGSSPRQQVASPGDSGGEDYASESELPSTSQGTKHDHSTLSLFDWHGSTDTEKPKGRFRRRFSLWRDSTSSTGSGNAAAASEAPAAKARQLASSRLTTRLSKRGSGGRSARLRRSKMGVAGAIRLQLSYHPVSDKPLPYRHPEKIPPRRAPEGAGDAPLPLVRQPRVLGCLAVMLLASSITEVKLGVPAVSIRLGLQTHRMQLATGTPSGRCEWNFRCCFALELPTLYDDVKVSIGDATKTLASRIWENWIPFGTETAESEIAVVANARVPLADIFTAGKASGTWKLMRPDLLGQVRPCGHVSMRCAWLPAV
ncbi:g1594 [Coccomyxa elongata]